MKYKTILMLSIFALLVLTLSTVSAEDLDNVTDVNTTNNSDVISDDLLEIEDNSSHNHIGISDISDSPVKAATVTASGGTFAQLQTVINGASAGDTIQITGDYYYGGGSDTKAGVLISKKLTVIGNGHTLDGKNVSRIFRITAANVNITGINFIQGYTATTIFDSAYRGGAIACNANNLYVSYCNFSYCNGDGGSVYCQYDKYAYVDNCILMYNTATSINGNSRDAIVLSVSGTNSKVSFTNCIVANNHVSGSDQYILALSGNGETFSNNVIYNNTAGTQVIQGLSSLNDINYNWFGLNSPSFNKILSAGTPNNWIVMNFTNTTPVSSVSGGGSITLRVEFNKIFIKGNKTYSPLVGGIAPRTVKFSDNGVGTFNETEVTFNGDCYVTYTFPAGTTDITVYATIDEQVLKIRFPDPIGSFTELQELIDATPSGGTIVLTKDYEYEPRWDLPLMEGMTINKPLNIIGNGHSINGIGGARIFKITGSYVNLTNISFLEGYPTSSVGGGYYGAAIYSTGSYLKVTGCNFENNSATGTGVSGGVVYSSGTGSSFNYNSFYNNFGKVYVSSNNLNYNWWGTNSPTFSSLVSSTAPTYYVIMNFTNLQPINVAGGTVSLLTSLNIYTNAARTVFGTLSDSLPSRRVNYTLSAGTLSKYGDNFIGSDSNSLTYGSGLSSLQVNATVDGQTLTIGTSDLSVNVTVSKNDPTPLEVYNYIITVKNNGPDQARGVIVNFSIPVGFIYVSDNGGGNYSATTGEWCIVSLNSGVSRTLTISVRVPYNYSLVNKTFWTPVNVTGAYADFVNTNDNGTVNITIKNKTGGSYVDLQYLIDNTPNGGVLNLGFNVTYNSTYDSSLRTGMKLNKTIIINGNGYTINGSNLARHFNVTANNVNINNVFFTKGNITDSTGALGYYGGSIYTTGDNFTITNSLFRYNYDYNRGSAIFQLNKTLYVDNCSFLDNAANNYVISVESSATAYIAHSIFINNTKRDTTSVFGIFGNAYINNNVIVDNQLSYSVYIPGSADINNNWWGTNNPTWSTLISGGIVPETWVIMNFTNTTPIDYTGGTSNLLVTLNNVFNKTTNLTSSLIGTLPERTLYFNWTHGNVTPNTTGIIGSANANFDYLTYPNMYNWIVNATIDNQMLWLGGADIGINIMPSSNPIDDGENITFIISIVNNGPMNSTDINATIFLPLTGLNILNITPSAGFYNNTTGIWEIGNLTAGQTVTLEINGTLADPGPFLLWNATVNYGSQYDYNHTNNTFISNITVNQISDLEIHKNLTDNITPQTKDNITYMIVVYNNGPSTAINVTVFDNLSSKLLYINSSATHGYYNETTGEWFLDNMTPYSNETLNITVTVNKSGFTNNFVNVTSNITDNNLTNNYDNYSFTTPPLSDL